MIVLPENGGYWIEGHDQKSPTNEMGSDPNLSAVLIEQNDVAHCYRDHFLKKVSQYKETFSDLSSYI